VINVMEVPVLVVGTPALKGDDWEDLLAQARARPGSVRWASSGVGTTGHLVMEQVRRATGLDIVHIPYKGGGEQIQHALGGQFEVLSTNLAPAQLGLVQAGHLKALALGAPTRMSMLPQVHTLAELGCPGANLGSVFGLFAPARTPGVILERLNTELNQILGTAAVRQRLASVNSAPTGGSRHAFAALISRQIETQRDAIRGGRLI
jgi:tripartite-type tricarboxylate transporter receptor subunit TctC